MIHILILIATVIAALILDGKAVVLLVIFAMLLQFIVIITFSYILEKITDTFSILAEVKENGTTFTVKFYSDIVV